MGGQSREWGERMQLQGGEGRQKATKVRVGSDGEGRKAAQHAGGQSTAQWKKQIPIPDQD